MFDKNTITMTGSEYDQIIAERDDLRAEIERLQRENGALARTYAACEHMLRERTEQLNLADESNEWLREQITALLATADDIVVRLV